MKGKVKVLPDKGILREFAASRSSLRMAKGSSMYRKEMIKEGILKHQREHRAVGKCGWIQYTLLFLRFLNYVWYCQLLSDVVLNVKIFLLDI